VVAKKTNPTALLVFGITLALAAGTAVGAAQDTQERALAKARYLLKQMKAENQRLKTENTDLHSQMEKANKQLEEIPGLRKDLKSTKKKLQTANARVTALETKLGATERREAHTLQRLKSLAKNFKEHREALKMVVTERNGLELENQKQKTALETCEFKNEKLYQANKDMGERYESKDCGDAMAQKDGITGLKQVEIESILEEYNRKLESLRVSK
jgi:chromosome segregation ATPase